MLFSIQEETVSMILDLEIFLEVTDKCNIKQGEYIEK